jgi:large subunit ribosomal protein L14
MIFKETRLSVIDNSGAKQVLCIKVLTNETGSKHVGYANSILITTIKHAVAKKFRSKKKNLCHGEIYKVLLAVTMYKKQRKTGQYLTGPRNGCILLRTENPYLPFGNRIKKSISYENRKYSSRIVIMAPDVY